MIYIYRLYIICESILSFMINLKIFFINILNIIVVVRSTSCCAHNSKLFEILRINKTLQYISIYVLFAREFCLVVNYLSGMFPDSEPSSTVYTTSLWHQHMAWHSQISLAIIYLCCRWPEMQFHMSEIALTDMGLLVWRRLTTMFSPHCRTF